MREIFDRWIRTGSINVETDLVPIMLEYDSLYNDGTLKPEDCIRFTQSMQLPWNLFINSILKLIGIKLGYDWIDVSYKGQFIRRFWNEKN